MTTRRNVASVMKLVVTTEKWLLLILVVTPPVNLALRD